ncbi:MAG: FG-GAP-like repeat-containing protein [Propionibacteriaceae bacterium]|jgi:uncharacterized protein YkwD|nr:FG-GAP-like repeat-containing protein [Propionibacteriaceae bacterium]
MTSSSRRRLAAITIAIALVGLMTGHPAPAQAAVTPDTASLESVRNAFLSTYVPATVVPEGWTGSLDSCTAGTSSQAARDAEVTVINYYRALAGLQPVTENAAATAMAQQTALIMAAQNNLSHNPPSTWACWTAAGAQGAGLSDLAVGRGFETGGQAVVGYMDDYGVPNVGHREWVLFPELKQVGIGIAQYGHAMQWGNPANNGVLKGNPRPATGVAYPSRGYFPYELLPTSGYWSYSSPQVSFAGATVTVTKNGTPVTISGVDNFWPSSPGLYVYPDAVLVWTMPALSAPPAGGYDTYRVTISGPVSDTYEVKVFSAQRTSIGAVTIQGTPAVGSTLTAVVSGVTPTDARLVYTWYRGTTSIRSGSTYTVTPADAGASLTVTVNANQTNYTATTATSAPLTIGAPETITGQVTTTDGTAIAGTVVKYDNYTCDTKADITGGSDHFGTVTVGADGQFSFTSHYGECYGLRVSAPTSLWTSVAGTRDYALVASGTQAVPVVIAHAYVGVATISGTATAGSTVSATVSGYYPANAATTYQWLRDGQPVAGATATSYAITTADQTHQLSVRVTVAAGGYTATTTAAAVTVPAVAPAAPAKPVLRFTLGADMTGDGHGELLAVDANGTLWSYPGQTDGHLTGAVNLGSGFRDSQIFGPGDLTGDGQADILGITADGTLWLYPGHGAGPLGARQPVGSGWTGWRLVPAGDLTGDGKADILGINGKGDLFLFAGKGNGTFNARVQVGSGWTGWNLYAAGDLNGDGKADILGINRAGDLFQYTGKGTGTFNPKVQAGSGWTGNTLAAGADLTGDGQADLMGRQDTTHQLNFYKGLGNAKFAAKVPVDTGW